MVILTVLSCHDGSGRGADICVECGVDWGWGDIRALTGDWGYPLATPHFSHHRQQFHQLWFVNWFDSFILFVVAYSGGFSSAFVIDEIPSVSLLTILHVLLPPNRPTGSTVHSNMARQSSADKELADLTECSICTEVFTDPRILPCHHTFCLNCLLNCGQDS